MEITKSLGHGLIYFFTKIPLIGDAMAAFLAIVLIGTALAIAYRYKRQYHAPLAEAIEARVRLLDEITGGSTADVDQARLEFARRFNDIDAQMMEANDAEALPLRRTWEEVAKRSSIPRPMFSRTPLVPNTSSSILATVIAD